MADPARTPSTSPPGAPKALPPARKRATRAGRRSAKRSGLATALRVGAEPKLTPEKIEAIAVSIESGESLTTACALNAVSNRAAEYWLAMAREIIEQAKQTGVKPEDVESPWPKLPATLLVQFFRRYTHACGVRESNQIQEIKQISRGGAIIEERIEERFDKAGQITSRLGVVRKTPPDWRGIAYLRDRLDRAQAQVATAAGANPAGSAGDDKVPGLLEVLLQVWKQKPTDPRALPSTTIEGKAVKAPGLVEVVS